MVTHMVVTAQEVPSPEERPGLDQLLAHPAIWRGRSVAQIDAVSTGFPALDEALPGKGWPRTGLIEILIPRFGVGELYLLLPVLSTLTQRPAGRWCAWISPPFEPFAPALAAQGVVLERLFVARAQAPLWAFEQSLVSGTCEAVLGWDLESRAKGRRVQGEQIARKRTAENRAIGSRAPGSRARASRAKEGWVMESQARKTHARDIRRLQLAAEKGRSLGVLFRSHGAREESSSAALRVAVEPLEQGARITFLKSRGGHRGAIDLSWQDGSATPSPSVHGSP